MIVGRPVLSGATQFTSRLVVLPELCVTLGAAGASGVSVVLFTLTVTSIVSAPPLPSTTLTVTA